MRIGVIGTRSKHLRFFQESLSRLYPEGSHRITHICGLDAPELTGGWPDLICCDSPTELIRHVDAVIIALREGYQHAHWAKLAMRAGRPVFVDKPFTCEPEEAAELAALSAASGVVCTGGSTICFTEKARQLKSQLPRQSQYEISYQADPYSPFGGWFFYGSHLTDVCVSVFGPHWCRVTAAQAGAKITARVEYPGFEVILRSSPEVQPFLLTADQVYTLDDHGCYDAGMAHFIAAAEGKEPGTAQLLVRSTELMEAILISLAEGRRYPG